MPRAKAAVSPVVGKIVSSGREIHAKIVEERKPTMRFPLRSLSNVRYTPKKGYFEMPRFLGVTPREQFLP